jgi:hypothetical protein
MAIETRELVTVDNIVLLENPPVQINHQAKRDRGIYDEVPPWITLERPVPPYRDKISPEGWPPQYMEVVGQEWAYKSPNLWLLVQYLPDSYHTRYSHLGEFKQDGWTGAETRTVRGFEIEKDNLGKDKVAYHWFIRDRRELLTVYKGIPDRVVNGLFISPRK